MAGKKTIHRCIYSDLCVILTGGDGEEAEAGWKIETAALCLSNRTKTKQIKLSYFSFKN